MRNGQDKPATTDADLVRAARRGDKRAFVEIVARHQATVCGIALGVLGDFAASEDAAQEAFLTAWRKFHDLRDPERLRPWLCQIARNAALGHRRRQRGHDVLDESLALADEAPGPDEAAASEEEAALVRDSLAKLPESYRLPLILFYREGHSVRAVAGALEISEDAVKQRLARGREMLRDQMSGLVESVLTRTGPSAVFTMTIAAAIGALAAPAAIAGGVFAATAAAGAGSTTAATTTPLLTALSTTKTSLITAALVAAACVPVGYHVRNSGGTETTGNTNAHTALVAEASRPKGPPSFESGALFAEWRRLHEVHGTDADAMPALYEAIADIQDPFRRRAFRTALIAEWVQVDAAGGFNFLTMRSRDASQARQFFDEWFEANPTAAVDALLASGSGWERIARGALTEFARKVPARIPEIVARLPKSESYWDNSVRDAFAIVAEGGIDAARKAAESITGPNREQALAGVALAWAKRDIDAAIAWAKALPEGVDRDEILRGALFGKSAVDPVAALEMVGIVPPGGRSGYFASTTGARVLGEAAKADFDATAAWLAAHPGRLGHEDMLGMANAVSERMNADAAAFLDKHAANGTLAVLLPAVSSAILNEAGGQRAAIWEWLRNQPENDATKSLRSQVLSSAGYQDPELALKFASELPRTPEGDTEAQNLARSLFNGGQMLHRFDKLITEAPERLREPLIKAAFEHLRADTAHDLQEWVGRLSLLPEASRANGARSVASAWAERAPEEAVEWVSSLPPGEARNSAFSAVASHWAQQDAHGAAAWIATLPAGAERDQGAQSLAYTVVERFPRDAWDWALSISDPSRRQQSALHVANMTALRDPALVQEWIENGPLNGEAKERLQSMLNARRNQNSGAARP